MSAESKPETTPAHTEPTISLAEHIEALKAVTASDHGALRNAIADCIVAFADSLYINVDGDSEAVHRIARKLLADVQATARRVADETRAGKESISGV